ncbi:hypothetical protein DBR42_02445 [Pelomonas sp. HMWF004]|nr:hypothetical protein DBR42_02445 [Pelomonas sp. HMWF004]
MKSCGHIPKLAITLTALAAQAYCVQAHAQTSPSQLERVEVTGSNIKRISKESSSPVDVITAREIQASGARTALEIMKMIPSVGNDGYSDSATQNGFSRGVSTVSLRNLGATSTLVLINGRRMAPSAYANPNNGTSTLYDLNAIPTSAIERIEVFKDGGSAIYGSDAVAGVVNFILKNNYEGLEAKILVGANDAGEYKRQTFSASGGLGNFVTDGFNVMVGLDFTHKGRSMVGDKTDQDIQAADYRAINLRRNPYGSFLYNDVPWFTREAAPGTRSFPQTNPANMVTAATCADSQKITNTTSDVYGITTTALANRTFCNYNLEQFQEMQNPGSDLSVMARGTLKVSDAITGFAEVGFASSKREYLAAPRTISGTLNSFAVLNLGGAAGSFQPILEIGHPDNPFTNARAAVQMRFPSVPGGNDLTNKSYRAVAGLRGTIGTDIDWDSAVTWHKAQRDEYSFGFLRLPVLRQMLGPAFGGTNRSLASIAADPNLSAAVLNTGSNEILQWDLKGSTEVGQLPGGAIGVAGGVEVRREAIKLIPDAENAAGNVFGIANTAVNGSRVVKSAFVEVLAPVVKSLELSVAGRVDKYPGLKTNFVPKFGAKWQANDLILVRGSYSEGFRAPAVSQVTPGGAQYFLNGLRDPIRCNLETSPLTPKPGADATDCNKSISGVGGFNPELKPENSYSSSLGIVVSPTKDVDLLLGYYRIRKNGEVALASGQSIIDNPASYPPGSLVRDTNPALLLNGVAGTGPLLNIFTPWLNQGSTMTSGLDFEARIVARGDGVKWTNAINGNYVLKYERAEQAGFKANNLVGTRGGIADFSTSAPDIPRLKFRATSTFDIGAQSVMFAANYVSGISLTRQFDGTNLPGGATPVVPQTFSGSTCHYGGTNFDNVASRNVLGAAPTATNGRDFYINRYPGCAISKWLTFDVGYTYTGFKDMTLAVNIQNFTDEKAPYDPAGGQIGYNTGLHNPYGRYFTVSASYKFK